MTTRRTFLKAGSSVALAWVPLAAGSCVPPSTVVPDLPRPAGFPDGIALYRQLYENWSGEIRADGVWTCRPASAAEVAVVANWAVAAGYRVRARGAMHGWSPLTIVPGSDLARVVLADTSALRGITVDVAGRRVTAGAGELMDDLLDAMGAAGLGLRSTPATGAMTVGGAMAIGAHGAAAGLLGEAPETGVGLGSVSHQVVELDAVVWNGGLGRFEPRTVRSGDPEMAALQVHLGRSFVTRATFAVGPRERLRCRSFTDIGWSELFATPAGADDMARTFGRFLDTCGHVEAIWFPFTDTPWLKVWSPEPVRPPSSVEVTGAYNYPFSDHIELDTSRFLAELLHHEPAGAPDFGRFQLGAVNLGLAVTGTADVWGWGHDVTRYIRATTLRMFEGGGAFLCRRADVQAVVAAFAAWHTDRLAADASAGRFPINGPVEIRCSGVDRSDAVVAGAAAPALSAVCERPDRPDWDTAVWIDTLTVPGTAGAVAYYRDLEQWMHRLAAGTVVAGVDGTVRPEWSKGWAFGAAAWDDDDMLGRVIPATFSPTGGEWAAAVDVLDSLDPHRIFGNTFVDRLI